MWLLQRLGHDVPWRHLQEARVPAGERLLHEHVSDRGHRVFPHRPLRAAPDAESAELRGGAGFTRAELDAAARQQVQRGDAFGDARRMVDRVRDLNDAVSEPDARRSLARRTEEHLGRGGVRILLHEVVLDEPHEVEPGAVGDLDLLERVGQDATFGVGIPGTRELVLVEQPEAHRLSLRATRRPGLRPRHRSSAPAASAPASRG